MKKTVFISLFSLFLFFPLSGKCEEAPRRSLFVSVIQDPVIFSSREEIEKLIIFSKKAKIQTLFIQVYRANQAWFPSNVADSSPYKKYFNKLSEDPLALLIKEAHAQGLEVHAWLNLMSLSTNQNAPILKKYGPDILTRNTKIKWKLRDYKIDNQLFLEPGDLRVREELTNLVGEVVSRYPDLDGIQFDYIRYPDAHPHYGFTKMNMDRYKKATGKKTIIEASESWKQWKCDQVTILLKTLIEKARSIHPGIQVSATGLMPYYRAHLEAHQDWKLWLEQGVVDFVTLMCYSTETSDIEKYIADAKKQAGDLNKINIAIGPYKLLKMPERFGEQFKLCEDAKPRSCAVLHYGSLLENPLLKNPLVQEDRPTPAAKH